jgi:hypothetical protein
VISKPVVLLGELMKRLTEKYPVPINIFYTVVTLSVAAILVVFNSEQIIVPALGGLIIIYALYRTYMLIVKKEKTVALKVYLLEIGLQILIGTLLIYLTVSSTFTLGTLFGYLLGGLLIIRGTLYLYATRVQDHLEELSTFFIHIAAIIAGTYLIIQGNFTAEVVSGIILAVALKRSLKTGYRAYKSYKLISIQSSNKPHPIEAAKENEPTTDTPRIEAIQWKE